MQDLIVSFLVEQGGRATLAGIWRRCLRMESPEEMIDRILVPMVQGDKRLRIIGNRVFLSGKGPDWARTKLSRGRFTVIDLETTGLGPSSDAITEIGAVRIRNGCIDKTFSSLVDPRCAIPEMIVGLTGITNEMVEGQPTIDEVLPKLDEFVGDSVIVAHNAAFDLGFLRHAYDTHLDHRLANANLCTVRLARRLLRDLSRHNLDALCEHFGVKITGRHRALGDAQATAEVLLLMIPLLMEQEIETVGGALAFSRKALKAKRRRRTRAHASVRKSR